MLTIQQIKKQIDEQKKKTQLLIKAKAPVGTSNAEARAERLSLPKPVLTPKVTKPVWTEAKAPVTTASQQRDLALAKKVVSTTPGAFAYGVARGVSMPVTATAKLLGYQESPEEAAVRTLAESKRLTAQMDASKGMGAPQIIQGRSIAPEMVGRVAGSILPFSAAESAVGRVLPTLAGQGIAKTAARGAISGGALQALEEGAQGKRGAELAKSVAIGTALGAGADIGLGYLGKAVRSIKAGAKTADVVADIAKNAPEAKVSIEKELGLPEGSTWADIERQMEAEAKRAELDQKVADYYRSLEERVAPPVEQPKKPYTGTQQYGVPEGKSYEQFAYEQEQARLADEYMQLLEEGVNAGEVARRVYPGKPFSGTEQYGVPEGMDYATYQKNLDEEEAVKEYYKQFETAQAKPVEYQYGQTISANGKKYRVIDDDGTNLITVDIQTGSQQIIPKAASSQFKPVKGAKQTLALEERDMINVGKRNVKAYQHENPEYKPFFQEMAQHTLNDLRDTLKGQKIFIGEVGEVHDSVIGVSRQTSSTIENILNSARTAKNKNANALTYAQIQKGLEDIIKDQGSENNAVAKRVELFLHEALENGYKTVDGVEVPPNAEYTATRQMLEANKSKGIVTPKTVESELGVTPGFVPESPRTVQSVSQLQAQTPDRMTQRISDVGIPQGIVPKAPSLPTAPKSPVAPPRIPEMPNIERELFPSVERPITPSPKLPEPALKTAYDRANAPRQAIAPEVPKTTAQGEIAPSIGIGERVTPEPSIKLAKASGGAGIEPKIAKVEHVTGGTQTRTAKQQVDIDAITEPGTRERGLSQNVATDLNRPQQTIDSFNDDPIFYEKLSNKTTLEKAQSILDKGYDSALEEYKRMGRTFEAHKVPLGIKLSDEAVARGDFNTSREILADLAEELTSAGQFSQAANILRRSNDPEAATLFIHRQITKLNKDGAEQYGKKWTPVDLTDEELQAIKDSAGDQKKYDATMENIYNRIAKQIPSSNREKFDAWRRMAMLMNPKTHVRNIVGNTLMKGLERVSDSISQAIETVVKPTVRTKAIGWSKDADLVKTVQESWDAAKPDLTNASKYEISGLKAFNREKPIFKTKWIEFINNLSKESLEAEDVFFMKGAYQDALGQYMKANNLKAPDANATEYAKQKALEATFRQTNALSTFIEGIKRKKGLPGMLAEAAIPFSKTPANILMRGVDYSPFGLTKLLSTKSRTPDEIIDIISKGATGSSLVGLGMLLADNGWARGDYTTAKKEGLAEVTGEQPMSIITPQGSYTFDWAQPAAVPLAMGIAIQENLKKKNPDAAKIVLEAAAAGGDAIINMSMLQNLKDLMGGGFESPTENVISLPKQYLEQAFPSVVGQIARISDPKQRISYAETETQKALNQIKSKTPGARQTLEPKIDILGREVSAGKLPTRVIQNLLSPGTIKKKDNEPVVLELSRLYETNRDTRIIPRVAPKTLEKDKKEMKLTAEQLTKFQRGMGTKNLNDLRVLFNSSDYKTSSEEGKMKLVRDIVEDNYDEEKTNAFDKGASY